MEKLSPEELHIIQSMLVREYGPRSPFLDQLAVARVENRRTTGVGIFVDLLLVGEAACVDQINTEISEDYRTLLDAPCDLVGFTLFIRKGCLSFLEGYTFGDVEWPQASMHKWLNFDTVKEPQGFLEDFEDYVPYPPDIARHPLKMSRFWALHDLTGCSSG